MSYEYFVILRELRCPDDSVRRIPQNDRQIGDCSSQTDACRISTIRGLAFASLTASDEGEHLALRFGPLPLLRKTIRYAELPGIELGRTSHPDGWGIHYILGRGWTYNIFGSVIA